jgi:uridylate kinase
MKKKVIVISLGGSLIAPDRMNIEFLDKFKRTILKHKRKYNFVIVCGGGKPARNYINGLEDEDIKNKESLQCLLGIGITRLNARFMTYFFGEPSNDGIPRDMKEVKNLLMKHDIVFCGALRYSKKETSDGTAAKLARYFDTDFINLTNVHGLYEKDPKKFRSAKFITEISHKNFLKMVKQVHYKPGQHFILDKKAAKIIKKYNITTYILGPDLKQLENLLEGKHFVGTIIER